MSWLLKGNWSFEDDCSQTGGETDNDFGDGSKLVGLLGTQKTPTNAFVGSDKSIFGKIK